MTEAPIEGLHREQARAQVHRDGAAALVGRPFGPAGVSSVELPDGAVWSVDHAEPDRLVAVDPPDPWAPGMQIADHPVVVAAAGGEGALFLGDEVDRARQGGRNFRPPRARRRAWNRVTSRPRIAGPRADPAFGLILSADLASDPDAPPLVRLAAALQVVVRVDQVQGGEVLRPLVPQLLAAAAADAASVDDDELADLPEPTARSAARLAGLVRESLRLHGDAPGQLWDLARRLDDIGSMVPAEAATAFSIAPDASYGSPASAVRARVPADRVEVDVEVDRVGPTLVRVTAGRWYLDHWVRIVRSDGLVPVAQAPLAPHELLLSADLSVPPDLGEGEYSIQLVPLDPEVAVTSSPLAQVRAAVRVGRDACRWERLGERDLARDCWAECADRWDDLDDSHRAGLARDYARQGSGAGRVGATLADELDAPARERAGARAPWTTGGHR